MAKGTVSRRQCKRIVTNVSQRCTKGKYVKEITISVGELNYRAFDLGSGPLALCMHGFPDTAHTWRHLLPALAARGYRAVAPFQRGYAPTDIPADGLYQTAALARDANQMHEVLGADSSAVIIGHDWGARTAYGCAGSAPDRWSKVVAMAVPPGPSLATAFVSNYAQLKRSWYMFFFQHGFSDFIVAHNDLSFIENLWADWSPGFDASTDMAHVRAAIGTPENMAAALGYYRATLGDGRKDPTLDDIQAATNAYPAQPTLYLHGANDGCVGADIAVASAAEAPPNVRFATVADAGHFLQLEQPKVVNELITEFLAS
jgi:pimeloyl-ACP methyl ester carboxylesterase